MDTVIAIIRFVVLAVVAIRLSYFWSRLQRGRK